MLIEVVKVCIKCKLELPLLNFSKQTAKKDGLQSTCKLCVKQHRQQNILAVLEYKKANKVRDSAKKKEHRALIKLETSDYNKNYYEENKVRISEYRKDSDVGKVYRELNKDRLKEYLKKYAKANPSKLNAIGAKYRAVKLNATPKWLTVDDFKQIEVFYVNAQNFNLTTGVKHHVDHIVPLQGENVCGLHVPWNLQVLTASENTSKSNKFQE
jgi:hypothetical protein